MINKFILFVFILSFYSPCIYGEIKYEIVAEDAPKLPTIKEIWQTHNHPHHLDKWIEYADHYQKHFPPPRTTHSKGDLKFLEIGVQSGGSIVDWKRYFGKYSTIVGIDIEEKCKRSHNPDEKIFIEIGSQTNTTFLEEVCQKYGPFDVIIDDGGHTDKLIQTSLHYLFPSNQCLNKDHGIYAVEDLHTMMYKKYMKSHREITDIVAEAFHAMHARYGDKGDHYNPTFKDKLVEVHLYDSLLILVKDVNYDGLNRIIAGKDFFWNNEEDLNPQGTYYDEHGKRQKK